MNIKKTAVTLLVLAAGMFGGIALAQQGRTDPTSRPRPVEAAELDRLVAQPSFEQTVFKLAAEKVRREKKSMTTVEVNVTVRLCLNRVGFLSTFEAGLEVLRQHGLKLNY